ncbi:histidine phosphatase family protein [Fodinicola acaciae]|uniref:histidine phosphatase family protein n=1 Tax=Fodinicola acaciae TaxID=2681555 RepID=UPI0013D1BFF5|nr:histidine phosphatase family protein [Fodinicola acaciae]
MTLTLTYETHSITEDNENGIATGWLPGRLSARGRLLAAELGVRRRTDDLAAVFTSDLARAVETARLAFAGRDIAIHQDERLRECDYGDLNGCSVADLAAVRRQHIDTPFAGGQSYQDVVAATASFVEECSQKWDGRHILVIAHSANRWALQVLLAGARLADLVDAPFQWQEGWTYEISTGWVSPARRG